MTILFRDLLTFSTRNFMVFETMGADQQILQIEDFTTYSKRKKEDPVGLPRHTSFRRPCF